MLRLYKHLLYTMGLILAGLVYPALSFAQSGPANFNVSGGLFHSNGTPITSANVNFRIEIWDKGANCMLYSELHLAQDLSDSKGGFSLIIGSGSSQSNPLEANTTFSSRIFRNTGAVPAFGGCGGGVTLAPGDERLIRVSYDIGGGYVTMTPDVPITSAPYAMVAESLQGKSTSDFILTNVNTQLSQNSMEYLFTNTNYASLKALVDGTSTQYVASTPLGDVNLNSNNLVNVADPSAPQDASTKNYSDTFMGGQPLDMTGISPGNGGGSVLMWDQVQNKWKAGTFGSVSSITAGSGLLGGTIISSGTLSVDVGVTANKILQLNGSAQIPAVDGSLLTNVNAFQLRGLDISGVAPADGQVMTWNSTSAQWQAITPSGGTITALTGDVTASGSGSVVATISNDAVTSAKINSTGISKNLLLITDSTTGVGVGYMSCSLGQVLQWDANGWGCVDMSVAMGPSGVTAGTYGSDTMVSRVTVDAQGRVLALSNVNIAFPVTSVEGRTGAVDLIASDIDGLGSAALVNVGTGSSNVPQLDAFGRMPAVDGSQLTNLTAGSVSGVATGTGLVGGTITTYGTLSVDVGTTAGKIMQLTGGAQIPAVDGNLIMNINAVKLQARDVSASAPAGGQVLGWNATNSMWEPASVTSGTVTNVATGTGLVGGPISSTGTLSVDVGTTAGKIVQLDGSAQLPGVDGSQLTNLNATRIGTRTIATTAPGIGQYIGWNNTTAQWEPMATTTGTVTNVATGNGLVGGPISSTGTLSVDTGTTANKIVQLTGGAQIPAVDGNLVTNINAVKLQARDVSASAPGGGQVLGWNSSTSVWEPLSVTSGTVTTVSSGTGLLGGPISNNGTLSVDVGTTANKIMQLTAGAQIPAVDGNLVTNINAVKLQARDVSATAPASGQVLGWNGLNSQWEPISAAVGSVTNVQTGTGLLGGPITSSGTVSVDVGTTAGKIVQLDGSAQLPGVDGSQVTNLNATRIGTRTIATTAPGVGQYIGWNNSTAQWEPMATTTGTVTNVATGTGLTGGPISSTGTLSVDVGTTANKIMQLTAGAQIPAVDGNLVTNINAVKLQARDVSAAAPGGGQVLGWNSSTSVWEPMPVTSGTVIQISSGTGLTGGPISSTGTLSVDVGTTAGKIVQLDGSAQLPGVDGSQLTNLNATRIGTRTIATTAPGVGQYIGWNNTTSQWEPMATTTGTVTNVATGTGLLGGPISSNGTLSVDVGTTANKIMQLTAGAQIPAVDGNLVTNINAVKLQARDVSASAPGGGQVLGWNSFTSVWEPLSVTSGTVTTVSSGTGLLGGPISNNGTLSVDVGTAANKIMQLTSGAQIPAVDGNLVTNINAVKLQARDVSATAPTSGQVLGWNGSNAQWEPISTAVGSVTNVQTGTGLLGGPITSSGTVSVDVGTTANKIMQLTAGAQIPAVDGNLVTNINAVKLQARDVSASAPGGGQVLGWNSSTSVWEPLSVTSGTVTTVSSGTGLLGGPISNNGTLSVDVGTTAGKIVQLDGAAQLPGVDGSQVTNLNATRIGTRTIATSAPGVGQYLGWNNSTSQWEPMATTTGTVTNVATGTGLTGGPISSTGTLSVDVGTSANKIMQLTAGAQIPAVDGNLVTNINAVKLQARDVSAAAPGGGQVLGWNSSTSVWEPMPVTSGTVIQIASGTGLTGGPISSVGTLSVDVGTTANKIVQLDGTAKLPGVDGSQLTNLNATRIGTRTIATSAPGVGQYLGWNNSTSQWEPMATTTGTVTNVSSGTGLVGGPISSNGTLSVDVGTAANKIMQLTAGAQIPAVDGNLVTNVNAVKLQARDVSASAPGGGQVLGWNATTSVWEPSSVTSGTVTTVSSGTGLVGGPISSNGTLSVDVGTAANKIMQLTAGAQIPAVDGNLVSNVNAVKLQTRDVASTAPTTGQVLGWNGLNAKWEPMSTAVGSVTNVQTGTGLLGGPITSSGTVSVDVGTTAGKIVQLDGAAQLPGVDGSQVTNLNATRIGTRTIATSAPGVGQYLGWNNSTSQWEPMATTTGTVTNVATGTGLTGGPISSTGTLSVDVGTTANKVMQLTAGAQIPAVDGNLVTNINAVKLQARDVSAAAPGGGQVLGWNSSTSVWEPMPVTSGTVIQIASGTGLTGGPISSVGTLSVDVGTTANKIVQLDGTAKLPGVDGSQLTNLNATRIGTRTIATSAPGVGQYLGWNNSTSQWEPMATTAGTVTNVATGTGLLGGPISSNGTLSVDVGTAANKIMQLTAGAQIPAVDGNLVTNINAVKLQARDVSASAPAGGQVLGWNATTSVWEPSSVTSGTVTTVSSGTGLVGGPISSNGTLSVDVGTAANKIMQLTAGAQIPAVDGNLVSNVNAVKLQTRDVASTAPTSGQVLGWNGSNAKWEPMSTAVGSVTNVQTGTGLVGGSITSSGTISVDVGTTANKVMQLTAGAQIPAVDGNLVTNINAVKLQARDVSASAPGGGQVLGWNAATSVWEPSSVTSGTVTTVSSGTGLVGGPITNNGTLSVDVGTTANKIVQLDGTAKLPGVDGSQLTNLNATRIGTRTIATSAPGVGQYLGWNNSTSQWEPMAATSGTVTNVATGTGLTGGPISSTGTLSVDVGTTANKVMQLTAGAQIPAVDGNLVTNINAVKLQARDVSASAPGGGQVLGWNATTSVWEPSSVTSGTVTTVSSGTGLVGGPISNNGTLSVDVGTAANKIMQLTAGAQIPAVDGNLVSNINAVKLQTRDVAATAPTSGQVLGWNGSNAKWEPMSTAVGSVTNVQTGTGLVGGSITSSGTISVDVGTTANKVMQLTAGAQIPAVDGNLVTNINAVKLQARDVSASAPAGGQVLGWNATTSVWEPSSVTSGTVTTVSSGTGLVGGPISNNGTLSVDVGTAANKILQLTAGAQIPAVDGNLVSNINAVKLQTRDVAATAPTSGQVLGWNGSNAKWEPMSTAVGSVTNVQTGTGLVGGSITSSGTISVDVGTTANKIVQLDGAAQLPGVDGSQVTNLNATRIGTRTIATSAPGVGQYLGWNNSTSQWEPMAAASGTVTTVSSGTGLVGGPISNNGTLSVDVGTAANKIMQLTAGAQIPAVDGNLVSNINAVKLQTRDVASTAPTSGQVLGWNGSNATWEPMSTAVGSVTNVQTGTGLVGGPITSSGTISVDVGTTANKIVRLDGSAQLPGVDGSQLTNLNATRIGTRTIATSAPGVGQYLGWNNSTSQWEPMAATSGTVTNVATGTGLTGGPISSTGTLSVDVGTTANKVMQLTAGAQIPAVDGNLVTNINAVKLQARDVSASAPAGGQVLGWNATTSVWEPSSVTSGTVTTVSSGTGLVGGPISNNGTLSVDVGTAANKIMQLTAGAQIPAVDGNLVSNINAVKLQTRDVASTAPTSGQVLGWNGSNAKWEPMSTAVGSVTNVQTGTGLVGGSITSSGTISVDVGTTANKVMQLTAGAQIPAVDGNLVTNINAVKLQARDVSASAPSGGQVLGWNAATSVWEPSSATSGTVTTITSGNGLIGGPITNNGTLSVDVGTAANKIVQLDGSAKLPAVDGYQLTNLNATRIGTRTVATSAPGAGQFLGWNSSTSQWEPSSGASATGISGAIQYSSGSGTFLSNNNIVIDGTNGRIGIANTAPAFPLDVAGGIAARALNGGPAALTIYGKPSDNSTYAPIVQTNNGLAYVGAMEYTTTGVTMKVGNPLSDVMTWLPNGNVGVGNTNPQALLDLATTTSGHSAIIVPRDTAANRPPTGVNGMIRFNTTSQKFEAYQGAWQDMIASGSGNATQLQGNNVQAGVPTNGTLLTWNSSGSQWEARANSAVSTGLASAIQVGNGTGGFLSNNNIVIDTTNGRLGIGTTTPSNKLTVLDTVVGNVGIEVRNSSTNGGSYSTIGSYTPTYYNEWRAYEVGFSQIQTNAQALEIKVLGFASINAGSAERMRIEAGGNIGIGTASPLAILDVTTTTSGYSAIILPRDTAANRPPTGVNGMIRYNTNSNAFEGFANGSWGALASGASGNIGAVQFSNGAGALSSNNNIVIDSTNGRLGVGTNAPTGPLHVVGGTTASGVHANSISLFGQNTGGGNANGGQIVLVPGAKSGSGTDGFVYIGGQDGSAALQVYSPFYSTPAISVTNGSNVGYATTQYLGNGRAYLVGAGNNSETLYGVANKFFIYDSTAAAMRMTVDTTGNVGIGTPSPEAKFDVLGYNIQIGADWATGTARTNSTNKGGVITVPHYTKAEEPLNVIEGFSDSTGSSVLIGGGTSSYNAATIVALYTAANNTTTTGTERMRVDGNGNVGIGTITPRTVLDVASTTSGYSGIIIPRDTQANRPSGVNGMIRFNTTSNKFEAYQGLWQDLIASGGGASSSGNNGVIQVSDGSGSFASNNNIAINTTTGSVGIGTPTPGRFLELVGADTTAYPAAAYSNSVASPFAASGKSFKLVNTAQTDTSMAGIELSATNSSGIGQGAYISAVSVNGASQYSPSLVFATRDSATGYFERMRVHYTGEVTVGSNTGATNPLSKLTVWNPTGNVYNPYGGATGWPNGFDGITVARPGTTGTTGQMGGYGFKVINSSNTGQLAYITAVSTGSGYTPTIAIGQQTNFNSYAERLRIDAAGSVGIGTTMPQAILDVATTTSGYSAIIVPRDTQANRPPTGVNGMIRYNSNSNSFEGFANGSWGNISTGSSGGQWNTGAANSINYMLGNVGIRTSSPASALDVVGEIHARAVETGDSYARMRAYYNSGATTLYLDPAGTDVGIGHIYIGTSGATDTTYIGSKFRVGNLYFPNDVTPFLNSFANGNNDNQVFAGWGVTNVTFASGYTVGWSNVSHGSAFGGATIDTGISRLAAGKIAIGLGPQGSAGGTLFAAQVGVGTTTPQAMLDIQTTTSGQSALLIPRGSTAFRPPTGVNGMIRYNASTSKFEAFENSAWVNMTPSGAGTSSTGNNGAIQFGNGTGGFLSNNNVTVDSTNGRIGIGTAAPAEKLEVTGNIRLTGAATTILNGSATSSMAVGASPGAYFQAFGNNYSVATQRGGAEFTFDTRNSGTGGFTINGYDGSTWTNYLKVASTGNVGIGTTVPAGTLHVQTPATTIASSAAANVITSSFTAPTVTLTGTTTVTGEMYSHYFTPATYTDGSALTINDASSVYINGPPRDAGSVTLTDAISLHVAPGTATNSAYSWGAIIESPTGAANNYAAAFNGGRVGIGTLTPRTLLELTTTTSGHSAIILPRDTTANRPPTGINGMIRYNSTTNKFEGFQGVWQDLIAVDSGPSFPLLASPIGTAGNAAYSFTSDGNTGMYSAAADNLNFATTGVQRLHIDHLGNVAIGSTSQVFFNNATGHIGIGTAAPQSDTPLHIFKGSTGTIRTLVHNTSVGASVQARTDLATGTANSYALTALNDNNGAPYYQQSVGSAITGSYYDSPQHVFRNVAGVERLKIDSATGNVGIGGITPGSMLDVQTTTTAMSGTQMISNTILNLNPGGASTAFVYGDTSYVYTAATNRNYNVLQAKRNGVIHNGTGTVTSAHGDVGSVSNSAGGTLSSASGVVGDVVNLSSGTITNGAGLTSSVTETSGTITNAYGVYIGEIQGDNMWSIWAGDVDANSYFAGKVGIGTPSPTVALEVNGHLNIGSQTTRTTTSNRGQMAQGSTYLTTSNTTGVSIDWNNGNIQELNTFLCNGTKTIAMSNMKDGAVYTLLFSGTAVHSGTCVFTGYTFKTSGAAVAPTASRDVIYTFVKINATVIYTMTDNLQ